MPGIFHRIAMSAALLAAAQAGRAEIVAKTYGTTEGSVAEAFNPAQLEAIAFTPQAGYAVGGAKVRALQDGTVRLALYSHTGANPLALRWQSAATTVAASQEQAILFSGVTPKAEAGSEWVLLIEPNAAGVIGGTSTSTGAGVTGFRLPFAGGAFPASFSAGELVPRSGAVSLVAVTESPITFFNLNLQPRHGNNGYTSSNLIGVYADGEFLSLEVSEDAAFTDPTSFLGSTGTYTLKNFTPGSHPLYVRGTGNWQRSATLTGGLRVDLTPPSDIPAPVDTTNSTSMTRTFEWQASSDPESQIIGYAWEVTVSPSGRTVTGFNSAIALDSTKVTVTSPGPGTVRCRVMPRNYAGLAAEWSPWSQGIEVLYDELPDLLSVETSYQVINTTDVWYRYNGYSGNPAVAQMTESSTFTPPVQETDYHGRGWIKYDLGETLDGIHEIHHRLKTGVGVSDVRTTQVFLDRIAPVAEAPVPSKLYSADGKMDLEWRVSHDPQPSSGIKQDVAGAISVQRVGPGDPPLYTYEVASPDIPTTVTVSLASGVPGGAFRVGNAVTDNAGNTSEPAFSQTFLLNARPAYPNVTIAPNPAPSDSAIRMTASAVDPDGDAILEYRLGFRKTQAPFTVISGDTLPVGSAKRGQSWVATAVAVDSRHAVGFQSEYPFVVANGKPTQPIVNIQPRSPAPGATLTVSVIAPSMDPDGDLLGYDFRWSRSPDGLSWTARPELNGLATVSGTNVKAGDFWQVEYTPYEKTTTAKDAKALRVEGPAGKDFVRVGADNTPPVLRAAQPLAIQHSPQDTPRVHAAWTCSDREGGPIKLSIYLTDLRGPGQLIVSNIDGALGSYEFDVPLPPGGGPYYLRLEARDNHGALTQLTTQAIIPQELSAAGWMLN